MRRRCSVHFAWCHHGAGDARGIRFSRTWQRANTVTACDWPTIKPGIMLTMSFGLVEFSGETTVDGLLARADKRLYEAKDGGRNRVCG